MHGHVISLVYLFAAVKPVPKDKGVKGVLGKLSDLCTFCIV